MIINSVISGGGGSVTIPQVSNIAVDTLGVLTFDAPDITDLQIYNPVISYIVSVNGTEMEEVSENRVSIRDLLVEGNNTVVVVTKAILTDTSSGKNEIVAFSIPQGVEIYKLNEELPTAMCNIQSLVQIGTKCYLVNGDIRSSSGGTTDGRTIIIYDFETKDITETSTILSGSESVAIPYENNILLFSRHSNRITKFDTTSLTLTTLSDKLSASLSSCKDNKHYVYGNYLYVFGGKGSGSGLKEIKKINLETWEVSTISISFYGFYEMGMAVKNNVAYFFKDYLNSKGCVKFDFETDTLSYVSVDMTNRNYTPCCQLLGDYIYIIGGNLNNACPILRFDTISETTTTLSTTTPYIFAEQISTYYNNEMYLFGGRQVINSTSTLLNTIYKIRNLQNAE